MDVNTPCSYNLAMSRDINPFGLRMPPELRERIEESARESGRSMNAEIVHRLNESFEIDAAEELSEEELDIRLREMSKQLNKLLQVVDKLEPLAQRQNSATKKTRRAKR